MGALVHLGGEAVSRLEELGLSYSGIRRALLRGDAESRTVSQLAPKGFEGLMRWGRVAEDLREDLCAQGWTPDDTQNIARSISPSGEVSVVVTTGGHGTGVEGSVDPTTKYTKGAGVAASVEANLMLDFDPEDLRALGIPVRSDGPMQTWFLMFAVDGNTTYSEVSLPDAISEDGRITRMRERIILPPIVTTPTDFLGEGDGPSDPVDVPVSRRRTA
jgi:hypothetical protein